MTALPVAAVTFSLIIAMLSTSVGLLITFVIALPFAWLTFVLARGFGHFERGRRRRWPACGSTTRCRRSRRRRWWGRLKERAQSRPRWREIAYHLAHLPVAALAYALTMAAWCGSLAMLLLPLYVDALPGDSAKFYFFEITQGAGALAAALVGTRSGSSLVAPWVTVGVTRVSVALARALLGPSADAAHAAQVQRLETSRSAAVDSAEAERRRIERDLHDGAQQRLVALAAGLGRPRRRSTPTPRRVGACSPTPTRRPSRRSRRSATSSAASTR